MIYWYLTDKMIKKELGGAIERKAIQISDLNDKYEITLKTPTQCEIANDNYVVKYWLKEWDFNMVSRGVYERKKRVRKNDDNLPIECFENITFSNSLLSMSFKQYIDDNGEVNCKEILELLNHLINTSIKDLELIKKLIVDNGVCVPQQPLQG